MHLSSESIIRAETIGIWTCNSSPRHAAGAFALQHLVWPRGVLTFVVSNQTAATYSVQGTPAPIHEGGGLAPTVPNAQNTVETIRACALRSACWIHGHRNRRLPLGFSKEPAMLSPPRNVTILDTQTIKILACSTFCLSLSLRLGFPIGY